MPYKFNGKEFDEETGLYYYGARYMNPVASIWYGVDPLAEKYTNVSAYTYCLGNPVKLIDSDGKKVYLFATQLPMDDIHPLYKWILQPATHTFIVVTNKEGKPIRYAAYGPENDKPFGTDRLMECHYYQDINVYTDYFNSKKRNENLKENFPLEIETPDGLTEEQFDKKVIDVINSFGNNSEIKYDIFTNKETTGNCNTSSSTILIKSGVTKDYMQKIYETMPGIKTGFNTADTRPWTKSEQKAAVEKAKKREQEKIKELQNTVWIP